MTPHPVKQEDLVLQREYVNFDRTVTAHYWIFNPTEKSITVTMGFPIGIELLQGDPDEITALGKKFADSFSVTVGGKRVQTTLLISPGNDYPIVFTWEMTFPPKHVSEYLAEYPLNTYGISSDSGVGYSRFTYITHTGSYWAQPIGEATFEFCAKELMEEMRKVPSGKYWLDDKHDYVISWTINPSPYEIDKKRDCV
jgi:hypothetical protein